MSTELLELAIDSTRRVLAGVVPEQLRDPTPCTKWNVGQLINHVIGGQFFFLGVLANEDRIHDPSDFSKGNFLSVFDIGASLCVEAFANKGVMSDTFSLFSSEMLGSSIVRIAATDTFVHGWDLARATGQSTDLSPDLAVKLLVAEKIAVSPIVRSASGSPFAPERTPGVDASEADRLAAYFGRHL
jgi:uncharacterized protein (TIGR03086 family)